MTERATEVLVRPGKFSSLLKGFTMPGFRSDNARSVRTSVVIHDFDQWTNPNDTGYPGCMSCRFVPDPSQECEV